MKKKRFSQEQIHAILKESEAGMATKELCRKYVVVENTFYRSASLRPQSRGLESRIQYGATAHVSRESNS